MNLVKTDKGYFPARPEDFEEDAAINIGEFVKCKLISKRSLEQNSGYWGVIIPQIVNQLEARGEQFPIGFKKKDVVHGLLHRLFLSVEFMGERQSISSSELTVEQMIEYYENIARWYAETFHTELKMPEKQKS